MQAFVFFVESKRKQKQTKLHVQYKIFIVIQILGVLGIDLGCRQKKIAKIVVSQKNLRGPICLQ